ncbi:mitochondrial transcription factor 2 [Monosporozyma servazzii]
MLLRRYCINHSVKQVRWIHSTRAFQLRNTSVRGNLAQNINQNKAVIAEEDDEEPTTSHHIAHETSIQERTLFNKVFESMEQKKQSSAKKGNDYVVSMDNIKDQHRSNSAIDQDDLTVSFGKYDELKTFYDEMDQKPFEFQDSNIDSLLNSFKSQKKDSMDPQKPSPTINKNGELPIFKFLDGIEHELSQIKKKTLESSKENITIKRDRNMEVTLSDADKERIVHEERYKSELKRVLSPYMRYLHDNIIKNDYDMWKYFQSILSTYMNRDKTIRNKLLRMTPEETIKYISETTSMNSEVIPEPYEISMPCITLQLLTDETQWKLPSERRYQLAMYLYDQIKTCADITMYLYFGTVEFYNLLLELMWINYKDLSQINSMLVEMQNNGIQGDLSTLEILTNVQESMKSLTNDEVIGLNDDTTTTLRQNAIKLGVLWSRDSETAINSLQSYLKRLKRQLVPGSAI